MRTKFEKLIYRGILSVIIICICSSTYGCSGDNPAEQNFRYCIDAEPLNLDPLLASDYNSILTIRNIYEGLFVLNSDGTLSEGVTEKYEISGDGLVYTFYIKKGAKWRFPLLNGSSGGEEESNNNKNYKEEPVKAEDFVFAFKRLFSGSEYSSKAEEFALILNGAEILSGALSPDNLGVTAESDEKLIITLSEKNDSFLELLATLPALPCNEDFFLESRGKYGLEAETTASNGAFYMEKWGKNSYINLKRNEVYHSQCIPDLVVLEVNPDKNSVTEKFFDGEVDALISVESREFENQGFEIKSFENTVWGLGFNLKSNYIANENIRAALSLCIDRDGYSRDLPHYFKMADGIIPPSADIFGINYRNKAGAVSMQNYDGVLAKNRLNMGAQELNTMAIQGLELIVPQELAHSDVIAPIIKNWNTDLGVFPSVEILKTDEYNEALSNGDFDLAIMAYSSGDSTESLFGEFISGEKNLLNYNSDIYRELLSAAESEGDLEKRLEYYKTAEEMLLEENIFIPLYFLEEAFILAEGVSGIEFNESDRIITFKNAFRSK